MLLHDVDVTFGRASRSNANRTSSMNLVAWSRTPVWKPGSDACIANLPKSNTGTLENPVISEEGRRFLADLLLQLTDRQLYDLFTVSRRHAPRAVAGGRTLRLPHRRGIGARLQGQARRDRQPPWRKIDRVRFYDLRHIESDSVQPEGVADD